jgi:hypothetical protein
LHLSKTGEPVLDRRCGVAGPLEHLRGVARASSLSSMSRMCMPDNGFASEPGPNPGA